MKRTLATHAFLLSRAVIGKLDEELDKQIDFSTLQAEPLQHVIH